MTTIQVSEQDLRAAGFSKPAQANTFYPPGDQDTHVHLGVPTNYEDQIAPAPNRFVTYISIKKDGQFYARLVKDDNTGTFCADLGQGRAWPDGLREPLDRLGLLH